MTYYQLIYPYLSYLFFGVGCFIVLFIFGILLLNPYQKQVCQTKRATKSILRAKRKYRPIYATIPEVHLKTWQTLDFDMINRKNDCDLIKKLVFDKKRPFWLFDLLILPFCLAILPVSATKLISSEFDATFFVPFILFLTYLLSIQTRRLTYLIRTNRAKAIHDKYINLLKGLFNEGYKPIYVTTTEDNKKKVQFVKIFNATPIITTKTLFDTTQNPPTIQNPQQDADKIEFLTQSGIDPIVAQEIEQLQRNLPNISPEEETHLNKLMDDAFKQTCNLNDA